jgi:putative membrane protein
MKKSFNIIALGWTLLIASALIASCGDSSSSRTGAAENKDAKEQAEEKNDAKFTQSDTEKDAQYIVDAYSHGLCQIELAKQAAQYAGDKSVKDLAATLIAAHVNMDADIEKLAAKKQISIQKGLTDKQLDDIKSYKDKKGREYSKAYLDKVIDKHKDAIAMYEKAAEKSADPDIRNYFSSSIGELRKHSDMAINVRDRLK